VLYVYAKGNGGGFINLDVIMNGVSTTLVLPNQAPFPGSYAGWQVGIVWLHASQLNSVLLLTCISNAAQGLGGIQLVRVGDTSLSGTPYCFADGSTGVDCPCGNQGISGRSCANLLYPSGAQLTATGSSSVSSDTLVLQSTSMSGAQSWYLQSTGQTAQPLGYGLMCLSGAFVRVGQKAVMGGSSINPSGADLPLSVKGAIPPSGGTRYYQVSYRQANPPCVPLPVSNTNRTNGLEIVWTP
jgi:hypothetical protein